MLPCFLGAGKALERPGLQSLAALLGSQDSVPQLDAPGFVGLDVADRLVPEKHRWRLWLLERLLPSPEEGACPETDSVGLAGELLASLCLARPWAVWSGLPRAPPGNAWPNPFPWRASLENELVWRDLAHFPARGNEGTGETGTVPATATLVEPAWDAALDVLSKRCLAFLDSSELVACLYVCGLGVVLLAQLWRLKALGRTALFGGLLTGQLQGCLRECVSRLAEGQDSPPASAGTPSRLQQQHQQHLWAELGHQLLSYLESLPLKGESQPLWRWLAGALPRQLGALLLDGLPRQDTSGDTVVAAGRLSGTAPPSDDLLSDGSDDDWGDVRLTPSSSAARAFGSLASSQQADADFASAEPSAGSSSKDGELSYSCSTSELYQHATKSAVSTPEDYLTPWPTLEAVIIQYQFWPCKSQWQWIAGRQFIRGQSVALMEEVEKGGKIIVSPTRLSREQAQSMSSLRLALSHHCLLLHAATGRGALTEDDTFASLLSFVTAAKSQLSPWTIQTVSIDLWWRHACAELLVKLVLSDIALGRMCQGDVFLQALLVLRTLFEKSDLLDENELFALIDALRQLMQAQHRELEVASALLDLASASILPALDACPEGSDPRNCFLVILEAYATLQHKGSCNEGVTLAFAKLLLECSKEPRRGWVCLTVDGRTFTAPEFARRFLGSCYDSVRSLAAQQVALLLEGRDPAAFQSVLALLSPHLDVDPSKADERHAGCLVFSVALASAGIALGPSVGGCAVHALVEAVRDCSVPHDMVAKVLGLSPDCSGVPWGGAHVPYVVHRWLKQKRPLQHLPFQALGCSSAKQFLERHWRQVLSCAVEQCCSPAVTYVSATLGQETAFLVAECAPTVLSHVLPYLAEEEGSSRAHASAVAAREFLEAQLSPK
ncbi:unnamed protein product, partial [Ixodes hexagonus]